MNVFYLDNDPKSAAQMQCDRHIVKMILETAQLLSTAHRKIDGDKWANKQSLYKKTHKNHPCSIWVCTSSGNYNWLYRHFVALCDEYSYRYNKTHLTDTKFRNSLRFNPTNIVDGDFTPPPQCIPDEYKSDTCSIIGYRRYYALNKATRDWFYYNKNRPEPHFIKEIVNN